MTARTQIGFQEMLAVVMVVETFADLLRGTLWSCFIDNNGVLMAVVKGSCKSPETNFAVAKLWLHMTVEEIGLQAWRVESKAS